jgi:hypothetical protein
MQGELSETHSYIDFATAGQDAFARVAFLAQLVRECKLKEVNLQISALPVPKTSIHIADPAAIKVLTLCLSDWVPSTLVRRKSQPIVPGFPSSYLDIRRWLFLGQTLLRRKGRNGRSTERLPLLHSQRYVVSIIRRLILNAGSRKIIN